MTKHIREFAPSGIENVSRRGVLKGIVSTTGLVLAVSVLPLRPARADAPKWGADGMPHGSVNNPLVFVSIAPDGTVTIVCHRSDMGTGRADRDAADRRRRARGRLGRVKVAQATGRRGEIRQPGHRRLPFDPSLLHADAAGWRRRAHDAGRGRGQTLECRSLRRGGEEPRGRSEVHREEARLRGTRRRRQQAGRPGDRQPTSQGSFAVPLHRQGRDQYRRRLQHHDRSRQIWPGHSLARAEVRRRRAAAGHGGQGGLLRCDGDEEGSRASSRSSKSPRRLIR